MNKRQLPVVAEMLAHLPEATVLEKPAWLRADHFSEDPWGFFRTATGEQKLGTNIVATVADDDVSPATVWIDVLDHDTLALHIECGGDRAREIVELLK